MEHILLVEDEFAIRQSLAEILELAGYKVRTASDGKKGLESILEEMPDLVICDVSMPVLNGFELLETINQRFQECLAPPFLFLTAHAEPNDIRQGMNLGADDYILKPFKHRELLKSVRLRLDKRKKIIATTNATVPSNGVTMKLEKLALPSEEGLTLLNFDDIIRCEAERAYCNFHSISGKSILVSKSMKEFESVLLRNNFMKIHKSNIVNLKYAVKYLKGKGGQLLMTDGSIVPVSIRRKEQLMKLLKS
ncbi:MAG: hypothetical protein Crog4KO_26510 [Crocinitomicaceae bacterium]